MAEDLVSLVPVFKIEVDGAELAAESRAAVQSVRFEEELNVASMFVIKLSTMDVEKGDWKFLDLQTFHLGTEVKLYFGMDSYEEMMVGETTSIEPSFGKGISAIEVRGYDRLHRLRFGKKRRTFTDMKDSDIISTIAGDWGLTPDTEDSGTVNPYVYQNNLSDLEFVLERAKRIRYEVGVKNKTLAFKSSKEKDSESLSLEYKADFDEFAVKLSARYEGHEFMVQGWDFKKKEPISGKAKIGNEVSKMSAKKSGAEMTESAFGASSSSVVDEHPQDASDAEKVAIARFNTHITESVTGEGKCAGMPSLRAGKTIKVKGIGMFSGIYYVTQTTHSIDEKGYNTSFKVRRVGV